MVQSNCGPWPVMACFRICQSCHVPTITETVDLYLCFMYLLICKYQMMSFLFTNGNVKTIFGAW